MAHPMGTIPRHDEHDDDLREKDSPNEPVHDSRHHTPYARDTALLNDERWDDEQGGNEGWAPEALIPYVCPCVSD